MLNTKGIIGQDVHPSDWLGDLLAGRIDGNGMEPPATCNEDPSLSDGEHVPPVRPTKPAASDDGDRITVIVVVIRTPAA